MDWDNYMGLYYHFVIHLRYIMHCGDVTWGENLTIKILLIVKVFQRFIVR